MNAYRLTRRDTFPDDAPRAVVVLANDSVDARRVAQDELNACGCVWELPSTSVDVADTHELFALIENSGDPTPVNAR